MNFFVKNRIIICALIGLLFVAFGIIQGVFELKVDSEILDTVSFILMVMVFYLLFVAKKNQKNTSANIAQTDDKQDIESKDESDN